MSETGSVGGIDESDLGRWMEAYGRAWEDRDAAAAAALFTADARYRETPWAEPFEGREGVAAYWQRVTPDQDDIAFAFEVLAVSGSTGFARWSCRFRSISGDAPVELNGIFVLDFADANLVSSLREWWHVR